MVHLNLRAKLVLPRLIEELDCKIYRIAGIIVKLKDYNATCKSNRDSLKTFNLINQQPTTLSRAEVHRLS